VLKSFFQPNSKVAGTNGVSKNWDEFNLLEGFLK